MEFYSVDLPTAVFSILVFFGACPAYALPQPLIVNTPKSIAVSQSDDTGLLIEIEPNDSVTFLYRSKAKGNDPLKYRGDLESQFRNQSVQDLNTAINRIIKPTNNPGLLRLSIRTANQANQENFRNVIEALRQME